MGPCSLSSPNWSQLPRNPSFFSRSATFTDKSAATDHEPSSSPTRWSRDRPWGTASQHAAREVLCGHGLCEQRALRQTKAQLTRGEKVGPVLDRIGDGACAHGIGEIDDSPAGCPFAAIARATGDELSSDLELDEGKIAKPRKRRPFRSEIADRDGDRAVPK